MSHHHSENGHHHHHQEEQTAELSLSGKLEKLLDHWVRHNEDHAENYRTWAGRARAEGLDGVAQALEEAARDNVAINEKMEKALGLLRGNKA
ncbi:MAG: hypothetical protein KKA60_01635 [Proteobacteria bacterium]|nr:hypothetical protein [Pseudomonadota bacterium]